MVPKTNLTIQDYFRSAGLNGGALVTPRTESRLGVNNDSGFADTLARARAAAPSQGGTGQRIADYLRAPVASRMPRIRPDMEGQEDIRPSRETPKPERPPAMVSPPAASNAAETPPPPSIPDTPVSEVATPVKDAVTGRIDRGIARAAAKYQLPAGLIRSVIRAESNFEVRAVSRAGARGLMQLMPATARELGVRDSFDIDQNIDGGARYLRQMLDRFDGDIRLALSAYNAGPGTVARYNGEVPYRETREYVQRVLRFNEQYKEALG